MDKSLILNAIKKHEKLNTNKGFADFLGIKPTTLSMWYKRNTFDIELVFKKCEYLNPEWLLTGKGSMLREQKSGINQNVVGDGVTMVGGSVSGGSVQSGNTNTDNKKVQLFENQIKELKKEIKEKDQEITRLKKQVDKLFKLIP